MLVPLEHDAAEGYFLADFFEGICFLVLAIRSRFPLTRKDEPLA
jgi:hypothetical protein